MSKNKLRYVLLAVAAILVLALLYWIRPANGVLQAAAPLNNTTAPTSHSSTINILQATSLASGQQFKTGLENLPKSLQGTEVDGMFEVDEHGNLRITRYVRQTFDYFLSALGEEDLATILNRLRAYIADKLPPRAAAQASALLDTYIAYREALSKLPPVPDALNNLTAVRQQKQTIADLRSRYFDRNTTQAFFGDEEAYDEYTLSRLEILQNKNFTEAQKAEKIRQLQQQQPVALQEEIRAINQFQELNSLTRQWKQNKGTTEELRRIREQIVGPEAADRLEALDRETQQWDNRMNDYLGQRDQILNNTSLSTEGRQQLIALIRQKSFNTQELVRVDALERLHDQDALP
jgi:lipase chaperone LimK